MNVNKRNNYQLTGSIHTLSLISLPVTDIDESISPCFDTLSSRENLSYSKINANKLVGDLFSYDEFKTAFDTILGGAGIESYSLSRFDMRFDSFDPEHYRDYAKLNRYLISALAVTYNVQNCYLYVSPCKKGKKKKFYIHRLVAEVWCQKPDFEIPNCPLQVHHKLKVLRNSTIDVNFAMNLEYLYRPHHKAIEHIKSYQVQRLTGKWFYLPDVHAIAEYYNTSTYSIYQLLTRSPKEIKGNYEIYESDNIKIKVGKEK